MCLSDCRECTTNTPVLVYKLCVCQTAGKAQRITPVLVYKLSVCQTAGNAQLIHWSLYIN